MNEGKELKIQTVRIYRDSHGNFSMCHQDFAKLVPDLKEDSDVSKGFVGDESLKQELRKLEETYCLSELATGEKCDLFKPTEICPATELNECDFRLVRLRIRKLLTLLEEAKPQ